MKNILFLLAALIFTVDNYAQDSLSYFKENRKGKLFFSVGTDYRITPIYKLTEGLITNRRLLVVNIDQQNSGVAFNYNLDYFLGKNLSFGFSNSIRYDLNYLRADNLEVNTGIEPGNKTLIFGFHFYFDYHIKIFKKSEIFARIGISLINRGTEYSDKETFFDDQGNNMGSITTQEDFAYEPWNFALGYKKNRFSLIGGIYSSSNSEYTSGESFIIPYFALRYNLGNLLKK